MIDADGCDISPGDTVYFLGDGSSKTLKFTFVRDQTRASHDHIQRGVFVDEEGDSIELRSEDVFLHRLSCMESRIKSLQGLLERLFDSLREEDHAGKA